MSESRKKYILILVLTILGSFPIFFNFKKIIIGSDTFFHLSRIVALSDNISIHKVIPVYFNYLNHLGYGNGLFYPDLFLYVPAFLYYIGFDLVISYKIFILLINFFSLVSIYLCINRITRDFKCSVVGTMLYGFSLYRFTDMFQRGALGESLSFIFVPLIILGLYKIFFDNYKEGFYLIFGLTGIVLSHLISAYILIIFTVLFIIINFRKLKDKHRLWTFLVCIIFSMLITAYFWMPLLEQLISDNFQLRSYNPLFENLVPFVVLFMDFPIVMFKTWFPPGIGIPYFISIIWFFKGKIKDNFLNSIYIVGIILIVLTCFPFIWKIGIFYKMFGIIQFPWRFYLLATCLFTVGISVIFMYKKSLKIVKVVLLYSFLFFLLNIGLSCVSIYGDSEYFDSYEIMFGEYLPKGLDLDEIYNNYIYNKKFSDVIEYNYVNEKLIVEILSSVDKVEVPLIYYKGYVAKDGNNCYNVTKSENGLVEVDINDDTKNIEVYYDGTVISKVSKIISLIGIFVTVFYIYRIMRKSE